jgi:tetratricopeptide (TPR) repeat protein
MSRNRNIWWEAVVMAGLMVGAGGFAAAQSSQGGQGQPAGQQTDKPKAPEVTPLTLDAAPPVNAEEDAAFKAFQDAPLADMKKKVELGEGFVQKYPQSRYRPVIYSVLTMGYLQMGQVQKMIDMGEKAVELTPTDVTTLALLGQTISRVVTSTTPDGPKQLTKAEAYSKRALEITPTLPKPAGLTDEAFERAKNQTLATAHSGLALVYMKRGKYAESIPELEQSIKLDPTPDPVNYYLLGIANKSTSHFDDAVAAFNKCAATAGQLQAECKAKAEDAKKLGATQLSAPK